MPDQDDDELVPIRDVAKLLGVSESKVRTIPETDLPVTARVPPRGDRRYRRGDAKALLRKWRGEKGEETGPDHESSEPPSS